MSPATVAEPGRISTTPLFSDDLARHGRRPALITAHGSVDYAELDALVTEAAGRFGAGRRLVLIGAANTVEAVVAYLAALRAQQPVVLAPADAGVRAGLVAAYDPDIIVTSDNGWRMEEQRASTAHELHPDLALLLSTSGTTGSPKLVRLSRQNLQSNAGAIATYLDLTSCDRAITTLPMQYCYGLSVINSHLCAGAGIVLNDVSVVDRCFWQSVAESGVTGMAGVPHTFDLLDRAGFASMRVPSLRYLTQAGGRMPPDKVRRFAQLGAGRGWELFVMYGQTEATARMAYLPPALAATHPHTIGLPIPGGALTIDSPDDDGIGELVYEGPNVMLGYADHPGDLALGRTVERLATGDLARVTADGLYEVVGRRSRFIKPFGLRVDLDRIERLLGDDRIPGFCTGDDEQLVIAVEHEAEAEPAAALVSRWTGLPRTHVRVVTGGLPRLASGKPDYATVRRRALAESPPSVREARDPAGRRTSVYAAFTDVLGVEASPGDTFVGLGGDSLSYVEMSMRLEATLGHLPRDWHTTPVRLLDIGQPTRRRVATIETTAVLRAVAIVLIVGTHAELWHLPGGAHTLLAIAGYNFARFRTGLRASLASVARVAVPSMCWIAGVAAVSERYGWPNALLINGIVERPGDRWGYWFVEALVHLLVPLVLVLAVPPVGRLDRRRPLVVPGIALVIGLLIRFDVIALTATHRTSRPLEVLWLLALGWCAARASTRWHRAVLSAITLGAVSGFFGDPHRELMVIAGILLCVWVAAVPCPRALSRVLAPVAGASLYIYLTHWQVFPPLARLHSPMAAVAGSLVLGVVACWVARGLTFQIERRLSGGPVRPHVHGRAAAKPWAGDAPIHGRSPEPIVAR